MKRIIATILLVLGILILYSIGSFQIVEDKKQTLYKHVDIAFKTTITHDLNERFQEKNHAFTSGTTDEKGDHIINKTEETTLFHNRTDEMAQLTFEQKLFNAKQTYLYSVNPIQVKTLDSLFQKQLKSTGIHAKSAICYTDSILQKRVCSKEDSAFCKLAYATEVIHLGVSNEMAVQGFVKIPFYAVLVHTPAFIPFTILWLLLTGIVLFFFVFRKKKPVQIFPDPPEVELIPLTNEKLVRLKITDQLSYESQKREIYDGEALVATLTKQSGIIFNRLLTAPDRFLSHKDLQEACWGRIDHSTKRNLDQAIKRLKGELKNVKLDIENVRGKGYRLRPEPNVSTEMPEDSI